MSPTLLTPLPALLLLAALLSACGTTGTTTITGGSLVAEGSRGPYEPGERVDDWIDLPPEPEPGGYGPGPQGLARPAAAPASMSAPAMSGASIGLSTGGAKDVGNFRENIKQGYLPLPTDLTYEGLFYDYFFDTAQSTPCDKLFCPSYVSAVSKDPVSGAWQTYLAVGLNSGIKESDFARKKLNLVVVLDMSGSMSSPFDRYYYDQLGHQPPPREPSPDDGKTKMEVATESLVALLGHLRDDDRLGIVLFDDEAYTVKRLGFVGHTDLAALRRHILEIEPRGGTNFEAGMRQGSELLRGLSGVDPNLYENRIIFLTDAMPNAGDASDTGLLGMTRANAAAKSYATFIGIGVDFNSELVESISKIRGANYYSVHSAKDFRKRLDQEFELMVTPLVFGLTLKLEAKGYEIQKIYGSPEAAEGTGEIMKVNTLFPSKVEGGQTKGGIILLKLRPTGAPDATLRLATAYEDRTGRRDGSTTTVTLPAGAAGAERFGGNGIRKAVLLTRYADLLLNWMIDMRRGPVTQQPRVISVTTERGLFAPAMPLGPWERQSLPLVVPDEYRRLFASFLEHFRSEAAAIGDRTLGNEADVLTNLSQSKAIAGP